MTTTKCPLDYGKCENAWSCTSSDTCGINYYAGYCGTDKNSPTPPPTGYTQCWDDTPCKTNKCVKGTCQFDGAKCGKGNPCKQGFSCQTKKDGYCGDPTKKPLPGYLVNFDPVCGEDADCRYFQKNGYCTTNSATKVCSVDGKTCAKSGDCKAQTCTIAPGEKTGTCSGDTTISCSANNLCPKNVCGTPTSAQFAACWGKSHDKCPTDACQWMSTGMDKRNKCYHQSGKDKGKPTGSPHIGKTCNDLLTEMGSDVATCAKGYTLKAKGGYDPSQKGQTPSCVFECTPNPDKWRCNAAGSCVSDPLGTYSSQKSCKADCTKTTTPSRGNNTALIIILVIVGVLILGIGGFLIYDTTMAK